MSNVLRLNSFNYEKVLQAVAYLQKINPDNTGYLKIVKLIYLADRYHLRYYGCTFTNDKFVAMRNGPAGSNTANVVGLNLDFLDTHEIEEIEKVLKRDNNTIQVTLEQNDLLSKSAIKALEFANSNFGNISLGDLIELAHEYPEWKRHFLFFKKHPESKQDINIVDMFDNPEISESPNLGIFFSGKDPFEMPSDLLHDVKQDCLLHVEYQE